MKSIKIHIFWCQNITPKKKTSDTSPKKITILWLYPKKNPFKPKQPTNQRTNDQIRKKNETTTKRHNGRRLSSSLTSFQRHLYQGQTLIETSLHLILPALSLPFGCRFITVGFFLPLPLLPPGGCFLTKVVVSNNPSGKNMRINVNFWVDVPNLSQEWGDDFA